MSFLVTKPAPDFTATAVLADNSFDEDFTLSSLHGKYVLLFFYPLDFTFVCPTEILAFDEALEEFRSRDAEVVGISVDSHYAHAAWKRTHVDDGGIGPIRYPLVSDLSKEIARLVEVTSRCISHGNVVEQGEFQQSLPVPACRTERVISRFQGEPVLA